MIAVSRAQLRREVVPSLWVTDSAKRRRLGHGHQAPFACGSIVIARLESAEIASHFTVFINARVTISICR